MNRQFKQLALRCCAVLLASSAAFATGSISIPTSLIPCNASNYCSILNVPVTSTNPSVDVGNPIIQVQDWGMANAPSVILFLHGFPHSHTLWYNQIKGLDKSKFRVVTMDVRGQGSSFKPLCLQPFCNPTIDPIAGYTSRDFANDVKAVITALNLSSSQKLFLVGHSYSGFVLNDYLNAYGTSALAGVVYVSSAGIDPGPATPAICGGTFFEGPAFLDNLPNMLNPDLAVNIAGTKSFLDRSVYNVLLNFYAYPIEMEFLAADMVVAPEVRLALVSRLFVDQAPSSIYSTIHIPVLFIVGANDQVFIPRGAACAAALLPSGVGTVAVFLNTGHLPQLEQASQFNNTLMKFIASSH